MPDPFGASQKTHSRIHTSVVDSPPPAHTLGEKNALPKSPPPNRQPLKQVVVPAGIRDWEIKKALEFRANGRCVVRL